MLIQGDARRLPLADQSVQMIVTSPPYWGLRSYQHAQQLSLERTPADYAVAPLFSRCRELLREGSKMDDGGP